MKTPCRDCGRRSVGCHADCPDYGSFKAELEQRKQQVMDETAGARYEFVRSRKLTMLKCLDSINKRRKSI